MNEWNENFVESKKHQLWEATRHDTLNTGSES